MGRRPPHSRPASRRMTIVRRPPLLPSPGPELAWRSHAVRTALSVTPAPEPGSSHRASARWETLCRSRTRGGLPKKESPARGRSPAGCRVKPGMTEEGTGMTEEGDGTSPATIRRPPRVPPAPEPKGRRRGDSPSPAPTFRHPGPHPPSPRPPSRGPATARPRGGRLFAEAAAHEETSRRKSLRLADARLLDAGSSPA